MRNNVFLDERNILWLKSVENHLADFKNFLL